MAAVRDLHGRSAGVAVASNDLAAETLELDRHLFTELAGAK